MRGTFWSKAQQLSPWLSMIDEVAHRHAIDLVERPGATMIVSCHSPTISGDDVRRAFDMLRDVPSVPPIAVPGQGLLDEIIASAHLELGAMR